MERDSDDISQQHIRTKRAEADPSVRLARSDYPVPLGVRALLLGRVAARLSRADDNGDLA